MKERTFKFLHFPVVVAIAVSLVFFSFGLPSASPLPKVARSPYIGTWNVVTLDRNLPVVVYSGTWVIGRDQVRVGSILTSYDLRGDRIVVRGLDGISFRPPTAYKTSKVYNAFSMTNGYEKNLIVRDLISQIDSLYKMIDLNQSLKGVMAKAIQLAKN